VYTEQPSPELLTIAIKISINPFNLPYTRDSTAATFLKTPISNKIIAQCLIQHQRLPIKIVLEYFATVLVQNNVEQKAIEFIFLTITLFKIDGSYITGKAFYFCKLLPHAKI